MKRRGLSLAALVVLLALGTAYLLRPERDPLRVADTVEGVPPLQRASPGSPPRPAAAPAAELQRSAVAQGGEPDAAPVDGASAVLAPPSPPPAAPLPPPTTVTVLFLDPVGLAVPGVEFRFEGFVNGDADDEEPVSHSGPGGFAALEIESMPEAGRRFGRFAWRVEGFRMGGVEAELTDGGTTDLGTVTLEPGTPVSGRVVDPAGRPIAGARVWPGSEELPEGDWGQVLRRGPATVLFGVFEREPTAAVRTTADGTFRLPGVAPGGARLWAHAEGRRFAVSEPFDVEPGREVRGVELVLLLLAPGDRIAGLVLDVQGQPLPATTVRYAFRHEGFSMSSSLQTDEAGRFELVVWREAPHTFTVHGEEGAGMAHAAAVEPGTLDLVLQLGHEESFELRVTDPAGNPVEAYRVTTCVGDERSWSGRVQREEEHPDGRTRLGKPEGSFWIEVRAVGFALGKLGPWEPDAVPASLALELEPAPGLTGRVLAGGEPRPGVRVALYRAIGSTTRLEVNGFPAFWQNTGDDARTDDAGAYQLMPREAGEYRVRAEVEGFAAGESEPVRLAAGEGASDVDVRLGPGGTLVVQVVAPPGRDAAGVVVAATRGDGHPLTRRADAEGRAVFERLVPGRWNVLEAAEELQPFTTVSSSWGVDEGEPPPERPWVVEVHEGRTARYALVLAEPGNG